MKANLRRNGISLIMLSVFNLIFELFAFYYLSRETSGWSFGIRDIWGFFLVNLLNAAGGVIAFIRSEKYSFTARFRHTVCVFTLLVPVTLLVTPGTFSRRINNLLNFTTLPALMVFYTLVLAQKEEGQWKNVIKNMPAALDIRVSAVEEWFNSLQVGPRPVLNDDFAVLIERYVDSLGAEAPIVINLLGAGHVSEMMKDTMRETLQLHYEAEEKRIIHNIGVKYRRVTYTATFSILLIVGWKIIDMFYEKIIYWEIIGNIAAFGLWQTGYLVYDQNDLLDELRKIRICKHAQLCFTQQR